MTKLTLPEKDYLIRLATVDDIPMLQALLYPDYFEESIFRDLTYSAEHTEQLLLQVVTQGAVVVAADKEDDSPVAFLSMDRYNTFYVEPELEINLMYVAPEWRGSGCSRDMVEAAIKVAQAAGVAVIYAPAASGVSDQNDKLWVNLFNRYNFKSIGTNMAKFLK